MAAKGQCQCNADQNGHIYLSWVLYGNKPRRCIPTNHSKGGRETQRMLRCSNLDENEENSLTFKLVKGVEKVQTEHLCKSTDM